MSTEKAEFTAFTDEAEIQTPKALVRFVCDRLRQQALITEKDHDRIANKILAGGMKSTDWTCLAEAALKKETEDAQTTSN